MKYSAVIFILALATGSLAYSYGENNSTKIAYETITTTAITTYCPSPTEIVHGSKTYTVTEATTLTITDCPCTVTKPLAPHPTASTVLYTSCPPEASPKPKDTSPEAPKDTHPAYTNPLTAIYPTPTDQKSDGTPAHTSPAEYTGAAPAHKVGSLMLGAAALAALAL